MPDPESRLLVSIPNRLPQMKDDRCPPGREVGRGRKKQGGLPWACGPESKEVTAKE